jgi:hypothetical protein
MADDVIDLDGDDDWGSDFDDGGSDDFSLEGPPAGDRSALTESAASAKESMFETLFGGEGISAKLDHVHDIAEDVMPDEIRGEYNTTTQLADTLKDETAKAVTDVKREANGLFQENAEYKPIVICVGQGQVIKGLDKVIRDKTGLPVAVADKPLLSVVMGAGMMLEDVMSAAQGKTNVEFYGRMGGLMPFPGEILDEIIRISKTSNTDKRHPRDIWLDRMESVVK